MSKLVIVEDSPTQRLFLKKILEKAGFEIADFPNGKEALPYIKQNPPDLIISDINMPQMDGWEFIQHLKQDPSVRDIPVIFITATFKDKESVIKGFKAGVEDYIFEPFDGEELIFRIKAVLRIFGIKKELEKMNEELKKKLRELEIFKEASVEREMRIIELKREVNELREKLGLESKYKITK